MDKKGWMVGLALAAAVIPAYAQQEKPALARVLYTLTHINDTLQPDKPHQEEMVLYIGQHASLFRSYASERVNQQVKKQMDDPAFDGNITITGSGRTMKEIYFCRPSENEFKQLYELVGSKYVLDEDYPTIEWEIADETKTIGGYTVQKATGRFKGREYTVWFTTEVPFQAGPWKLIGLPGLVLEAEDSREEVAFRYAGFETLKEGEATVALPKNAIATNRKALDKLVKAFQKNPQAAMNARAKSGEGGGSPTAGFGNGPDYDVSRIKSINVKRDHSETSSVTNNPLELDGIQ